MPERRDWPDVIRQAAEFLEEEEGRDSLSDLQDLAEMFAEALVDCAKAFSRYGMHLPVCPCHTPPVFRDDPGQRNCRCGLTKAWRRFGIPASMPPFRL